MNSQAHLGKSRIKSLQPLFLHVCLSLNSSVNYMIILNFGLINCVKTVLLAIIDNDIQTSVFVNSFTTIIFNYAVMDLLKTFPHRLHLIKTELYD